MIPLHYCINDGWLDLYACNRQLDPAPEWCDMQAGDQNFEVTLSLKLLFWKVSWVIKNETTTATPHSEESACAEEPSPYQPASGPGHRVVGYFPNW